MGCGSLIDVNYAFMHCSISLTNQKQSVVGWREFAICCAHVLCSLAYCFSHCALEFPTHPVVILPCLHWHCLLWRQLLPGLFSGCLPALAGCMPTYLRLLAGPLAACLPSSGCLLDLGLLTPPRPAACRVFGCLPMFVSVHQNI